MEHKMPCIRNVSDENRNEQRVPVCQYRYDNHKKPITVDMEFIYLLADRLRGKLSVLSNYF